MKVHDYKIYFFTFFLFAFLSGCDLLVDKAEFLLNFKWEVGKKPDCEKNQFYAWVNIVDSNDSATIYSSDTLISIKKDCSFSANLSGSEFGENRFSAVVEIRDSDDKSEFPLFTAYSKPFSIFKEKKFSTDVTMTIKPTPGTMDNGKKASGLAVQIINQNGVQVDEISSTDAILQLVNAWNFDYVRIANKEEYLTKEGAFVEFLKNDLTGFSLTDSVSQVYMLVPTWNLNSNLTESEIVTLGNTRTVNVMLIGAYGDYKILKATINIKPKVSVQSFEIRRLPFYKTAAEMDPICITNTDHLNGEPVIVRGIVTTKEIMEIKSEILLTLDATNEAGDTISFGLNSSLTAGRMIVFDYIMSDSDKAGLYSFSFGYNDSDETVIEVDLLETMQVATTSQNSETINQDSIFYSRFPWGAAEEPPAMNPSLYEIIEGSVGAVPVDSKNNIEFPFVIAHIENNYNWESRIGVKKVQDDGSFEINTVLNKDIPEMYISFLDRCGVITEQVTILNNSWTATMNDKIVGSLLPNPHSYYEAEAFSNDINSLILPENEIYLYYTKTSGSSTGEIPVQIFKVSYSSADISNIEDIISLELLVTAGGVSVSSENGTEIPGAKIYVFRNDAWENIGSNGNTLNSSKIKTFVIDDSSLISDIFSTKEKMLYFAFTPLAGGIYGDKVSQIGVRTVGLTINFTKLKD